jgi:hypothetical protein
VSVFSGDWRELPRHCTGQVVVMDQTIGCDECGQNLWFLPSGEDHTQAWERLPPWAPPELVEQVRNMGATGFDYKFDDCHDPGDEDDGDRWAGQPLLVQVTMIDKFEGP